MKVLVTGAGALLGQGIIKSLKMAKTAFEIVALDPDPRAAGLFWADRGHLVPFASDPSYLERVESILQREKPDAVLVGTDVELSIFAEHRERLERTYETHIVVSRPEVVRIADDKWLTYQFLKSRGLPCPASALPTEPGAVDELVKEVGFPLIVKPRIGARSVGVSKVSDLDTLRARIAEVPNAVVQRCVGSAEGEYTSGTLTFDGAVRAVVTMRRDLRDGNTYRAYVEPRSPFDAMIADIALALGGYGPINFQFRVDQGVPHVFEINGRFSGTTPLRALAGFNEVEAVLRHVVLGESVADVQARPVVVLRYWHDLVLDPSDLDSLTREGSIQGPRGVRPGEP